MVKHKNELTFKTNVIIALNKCGSDMIARFMYYMYRLGNNFFGFTATPSLTQKCTIPKYDGTFLNWFGRMVNKKISTIKVENDSLIGDLL